jgi:hypothetical protein
MTAMNLGKQSQTAILTALKEAFDKFPLGGGQSTVVSDINLHPCLASGELIILDDDDHELARVEVSEWANCVPEEFYVQVELQLRPLLDSLEKDGVLEKLSLLKPYSFVLIDDNISIGAEVIFIGINNKLDNYLEFFKKITHEVYLSYLKKY